MAPDCRKPRSVLACRLRPKGRKVLPAPQWPSFAEVQV